MIKDIFLDPVIHERARLFILTALLQTENVTLSFVQLKSKTGLTSGNLWVQLKRLEEAGYVSIQQVCEKLTQVFLTQRGIDALDKYFRDIRSLFEREEVL